MTYKGQNLLTLEPEERARAGLFMRSAYLVLASWGCTKAMALTLLPHQFVG